MMTSTTIHLLVYFLCLSTAMALSGSHVQKVRAASSSSSPTAVFATSRRQWVAQTVVAAVTVTASTLIPSVEAIADDITAANNAVETKLFIDPQGYFAMRLPKNYFTLRRSAKGDLPDAKTGQGRRGSSIFTAGDMSKAEVVAVERFPVTSLLKEAGIEPTGDLSTFPGLGEPAAIANLINQRREKDKPGSMKTNILPESLALSEDGLTLYFSLKTEIDVQQPELLMETYGVSQLFRITVAKASLASKDGNMMAVFASALEQDYNGPDGAALRDAVASFTVVDKSSKVLS